jgi:hypothetical protein
LCPVVWGRYDIDYFSIAKNEISKVKVRWLFMSAKVNKPPVFNFLTAPAVGLSV